MQGPRSSQQDIAYTAALVSFFSSIFETSMGGFVAELNRSHCHEPGELGKPYSVGVLVALRGNKSRPATHGSWFAQPCGPLIMVWPQGTSVPGGEAWIMPARTSCLDP